MPNCVWLDSRPGSGGPQEGEVLTRLAKAGQAYYDPFTGLPMLVNQRKGLIYSVGRDGKDQEGQHA